MMQKNAKRKKKKCIWWVKEEYGSKKQMKYVTEQNGFIKHINVFFFFYLRLIALCTKTNCYTLDNVPTYCMCHC